MNATTHHHAANSTEPDKELGSAGAQPETLLAEAGSLSDLAQPDLQSSFGNAQLAAATARGPAPEPRQTPTLQLAFGNAAVARRLIQRKADSGSPEITDAAAASNAVAPVALGESAGADTAAAATLIVEDSAETVQPGQLKKTEFLSQLRAAVCATTADALAGTQWSATGCPYLDRIFAHYTAQDGPHLERTIRRYAPEAGAVTSAVQYIPFITARVRRAVTTWTTTGQITGVPEGAPPGLLIGGLPGLIGGAATGIANAASAVVAGASGAAAAVGSLLFKGRDGGAKAAADPEAVQTQLGVGNSLEGGVRSRMEAAYGQSFGDVQVHADSKAAELSNNLNARAFTVGQDIAFGAGEYQPGTVIGDALIAHELAHVMQQRGAGPGAVMQKGDSEQGTLEDDADQAAVGAVVSSLDNRRGLAHVPKRVLPSLKSGLRLQRCFGCSGGGERRSLADRTRDRDEISDLMGNPEANEAAVLRRIDALEGSDAADIFMHMGFLQRDSSVNELAGSEAGQRILDRVVRALREGDLAARHRADAIARILAGRRAPPSLTPSLSQQQELAQINNAINADSAARLAQYRDRALLVPLRLPVQLYQPGFEMSGGVYYDNTLPRLPPGEAGITTGVVWSRPGNVQQSFRYPLNFIRLGPLVLSHTDEYIRSTMWHEFQHYRRYLEARQTDAVQAPDSLQLEEELRQPAVGDSRPNLELEATSIQLAGDFDRLRDDEVQSVLIYLGKHMANSNARAQFRTAAIDRVRVAVAGDRTKQDRLLRLIGSVGRVATRNLNDLKLAIQNNLAPRPRRPQRGRAPGSR
jgi:hypothetical protein